MDAESGLVHTVIGTAAKVNDDVTQGHAFLLGEDAIVFADAGYQGATKRDEATGVDWHVAMSPGKRRALNKYSPWGNLLDKSEQIKARFRAKVEHPFQGHQVPVGIRQSSLQRVGQKYCVASHLVCAFK